MTIHNFCKEVFEGNYFMMRSQIDDQMNNIICEEDELNWADARDKQLEFLNELEIDVTDEDDFMAGEVSIYFDYDSVSAVEDWAEEQGHCLTLGTDEWEQYDSEVNEVLKCILLNNQLITSTEWA
ncbi:MAG: hypothetical protein PQJ35_00695, partial [Sphaerochaetaceae bacterium]|nr:hypothetical protein [Sphaerochaetaceae bacterium]